MTHMTHSNMCIWTHRNHSWINGNEGFLSKKTIFSNWLGSSILGSKNHNQQFSCGLSRMNHLQKQLSARPSWWGKKKLRPEQWQQMQETAQVDAVLDFRVSQKSEAKTMVALRLLGADWFWLNKSLNRFPGLQWWSISRADWFWWGGRYGSDSWTPISMVSSAEHDQLGRLERLHYFFFVPARPNGP